MRYAFIVSVALAAVAWTTTGANAHAQSPESTPSVDIQRALELEREAAVANSDSRRWSEAASLFREASRLRPANDPVGLMNLRTAGAIYGTMGELTRARRTMLELADRATEFGEVATAANALIDAAHVAVKLRDLQAVRGYYERAQRLALSSHLTDAEQQLLTSRLEQSPTLFASGRR